LEYLHKPLKLRDLQLVLSKTLDHPDSPEDTLTLL